MNTYKAPWGKTLVCISIIFAGMCLGTAVMTYFLAPSIAILYRIAATGLPLVLVAGCVPFVIRGYVITGDAILIRRLFWTTRLERAGLMSAEALPNVMRKSIRTCGNGGGFSITGWYWSKPLGFYRAFVTDLNRTVVLRFQRRTVVVSPEDPEEFVRDLALGDHMQSRSM